MASNRLSLIRGRLASHGVRKMSFSSFLDVVWAEIWDDCSPMGDQSQYREIVYKLFIEGLEPWQITYVTTDKKGKKVTKRLGSRTGGGAAPTKDMFAQARALHQQLAALKAATAPKGEVALPPDGG